jgi:putative membrane protein
MKNRYFNTFIHKTPSVDKEDGKEVKATKICISKFPSEILFDLIHYVRNHWEGGYKGVLFVKEGIRLHHRVFTNSIDAQNCIFEEQMEFDNCIFEEQTEFDKSSFLSDISFKRSIFRGSDFKSISFREVTFGGDKIDFCLTEFYSGDFSKAIFKENSFTVDFNGAKLYDVCFNEAQFERIVSFEKLESPTEIKNTKFERAVFSQQVNFHNVLFYDDISFQNAIFRGKTYFLNITSKKISENTINKEKEFSFNGAKFRNETYFNGNNYIELNFSEVEFGVKGEDITISFSNAKFYENIHFHNCKFYNSTKFEDTSFEKLVDFYYSHFYQGQQFHLTDFLDRAVFSNTFFHEEAQFIYCRIKENSFIRFESVVFEEGVDISRSNFDKRVDFWNIIIEEEGIESIFDKIKKNEYVKYKDDFRVHETPPSVYKQVRESFRIIKNSLYTQNNRIEGLKFYEKEMETYEKEIKNIQKKKATKKRKSNKYINIIQIILLLLGIFSIPIFFYTGNKIFYWIILLSFITIFVLLFTEEKGSYDRLKKNLLNQFAIQFPFILFFVVLFISFFIKLYNQGETPFYMALPLVFYVILIFFNYYKDIIILAINKWSNSFGINWVLGLAFTIGVGVVTYLFYIHSIIGYYGVFMLFMTIISTIMIVSCFNKILKFKWKHLIREFKCFYNHKRFVRRIWLLYKSSSLQLLVYFIYLFLFCLFLCGAYKVRYFDFDISKEGVKRFVFGCLKIINIIDLKPFDKDVSIQEVSDLSYLILFIGRIFIGYGYYQTIQAFRKFGKS